MCFGYLGILFWYTLKTKEITMEENLYVWTFWFSGKEDRKVQGYIKKNWWVFTLVLAEPFVPQRFSGTTIWKTYMYKNADGIIHGEIIDTSNSFYSYKNITLLKPSFCSSGLEVKEYRFKYLIFAHIDQDYNEAVIDRASFSFQWLLDFSGAESVQVTKHYPSIDTPIHQFEEINIKRKSSSSIPLLKNSKKNILIHNGISYAENHNSSPNRDKVYDTFLWLHIENKSRIFISWNEKNSLSFEVIEEDINSFKKFFSIVLWIDVQIEDVKFQVYAKGEKKDVLLDIDVIANDGVLSEKKEKGNQKLKSLFLYADVKDDLQNIIMVWFQNKKKQETLYNLYFQVLYDTGITLEHQFLNLVQALEWMYWNSSIEKIIQGEKYIVSELSKSQREKKENRKLFELVEKFKDISEYIGADFSIKWEDQKGKIKDIRNCFSHWWDRTDYLSLHLMNLVELLKVILELFIVKELCLPEEIYEKIRKYKTEIDLPLNLVD